MYGNMTGMVCKELRRRGFVRAKGRPVFFRHTLGLGGVYVWFLQEGGYRLVVRELQIDTVYPGVKEIRVKMVQLEEIEWQNFYEWESRLAQLRQQAREIVIASRVVVA